MKSSVYYLKGAIGQKVDVFADKDEYLDATLHDFDMDAKFFFIIPSSGKYEGKVKMIKWTAYPERFEIVFHEPQIPEVLPECQDYHD